MPISAIPSPTVTLFLGLPFSGADLFTIEDPVYGLIETGGAIPGDIGTEVQAAGYDIQIRRGRGTVLDDIDVGTATVSLRNHTRDYDPLNTSSPYAGLLGPGSAIHVAVYGRRIFTGYTDDLLDSYTVDGDANATIPCIDGLGLMARQSFDAWTTTAGQTAGPRMTSILNRTEVGWPAAARALNTGVTTLQADNVTWGSNPFNYVQLVTKSDQGYAFVDRSGVFTYKDRRALTDPTPTVAFADDGTGLAFHAAELTSSGERFYTQVSIDREGGTVQTASAPGVGISSAVRRLSISGLLMDSDEQSMALAEWLLSLYSAPIPRVKWLAVNLAGLASEAEAASVVSLDIGSVVSVKWRPRSTGSTIDEDYTVEAVEHSIPYDGPHVVTFNLSPVTQTSVFTIEDDNLGLIQGAGRIAF